MAPASSAPAWRSIVLAVCAAAAQPAAADTTPEGRPAAPVTAEHRYRLSAAIRPLLFWVGAKNVGGARIVWREDGRERRGYELLLGSDPARTPRCINRWGFVREDEDAKVATMLGVMNRSEEDSLDQAKARLQTDGKDGYFFKMIRARAENRVARAESTTVYAPQDFTFRELDGLQQFVETAKPVPRVRTGGLPPGTHPGLLFAIADLVRTGVAAARATGGAGPGPRTVKYTFNAAVYDLSLTSWKREARARYGARSFEKLVRLELESRNLEKGTTERFVLACGTEGPFAGIPVFVRYQPKWWFRVEGVLDETETL